jgi:hypothetical protein
VDTPRLTSLRAGADRHSAVPERPVGSLVSRLIVNIMTRDEFQAETPGTQGGAV